MRNIDAARDVLPASGWSSCGVRGRPLESTDLSQLVELGRNDANFVWERRVQGSSYFEGLLQFRLGHYWKYGFGVHGVWQNGQLIGQLGLQVLSDDRDEVEFAIFLGVAHRRLGIGACLLNYLILRCEMAGMSEIFAVVRPDNPEGTTLALRAGGFSVRTEDAHFGQRATVYRIELDVKE